MSTTFLLVIVAIAASVALFADSAMQWSLRLILDGRSDYSRARAEAADAAGTEEPPASQTKNAKAA